MNNTSVRWNTPIVLWVSLGLALIALSTVFSAGLENLWFNWQHKEEYSHGVLLPAISAFLIWQKKYEIAAERFTGSWFGVLIFLLGSAGCFAGSLSTLFSVIQYSFLIAVAGLVLAITGFKAFRFFTVPFLIMLLSVPLPNFVYKNLSFELQLISSSIGVFFIRLFDIPVYLEGNVIDLGSLKLQVVEACSGLRYLFPLMTLGFIAANFFKAPMWQRVFIFFSTIPITVLMNSLRIGLIGITVEWWGASMAEGFLHDFEGWFIFMACTALLMLQMAIMARLNSPRGRLVDALLIELPSDTQPASSPEKQRLLPRSYVVACSAAILLALAAHLAPTHQLEVAPRESFDKFPLQLGPWSGKFVRLEQQYIDELKFDDYFSARFSNHNSAVLDFYISYYNSQSAGQSAHSPRSCIPAGGWEIQDVSTYEIANFASSGKSLPINRMQVQKGDTRLMVYYLFKQRHRLITNEFLVKWYLFWDAIWLKRKDGALIRVSFQIDNSTPIAESDRMAEEFLARVYPDLNRFVPD